MECCVTRSRHDILPLAEVVVYRRLGYCVELWMFDQNYKIVLLLWFEHMPRCDLMSSLPVTHGYYVFEAKPDMLR